MKTWVNHFSYRLFQLWTDLPVHCLSFFRIIDLLDHSISLLFIVFAFYRPSGLIYEFIIHRFHTLLARKKVTKESAHAKWADSFAIKPLVELIFRRSFY